MSNNSNQKAQIEKDVLAKSTSLLTEPFKNTKRKILIAVNLTFVSLAILQIASQLIVNGNLPNPARDLVFYPLIFIINSFSAIYNIRVISSNTEGSKFLTGFTAWSSMVIIMMFALASVHANPNTATSFLFDFAFSAILIFIIGTVLNRKIAIVWIVIALISLGVAYTDRGVDFEYYLMTSEQVEQIKNGEAQTIEWDAETAKKEKIEPLSINIFITIWLVFILLAFIPTFFEAGVIGKILQVIPKVITNIEIASAERNKLETENIRMGMELDVAKHIQTMVLPDESEIASCKGLDVAARMDTAAEVGGDFYEVLPQKDGSTIFGIGDVTDHGLQSGVVMLMTQSAIRAVLDNTNENLKTSLEKVNQVIRNNVQTRLKDLRNLTISVLRYENGKVTVSGQHESILIVRKDSNEVEEIDTQDLGIYIGMIESVKEHLDELTFNLEAGDTMLLYTDGVTEAENDKKQFYGIKRLKESLLKHKNNSSKQLIKSITDDLYNFIGETEILDDITLLAIKRI